MLWAASPLAITATSNREPSPLSCSNNCSIISSKSAPSPSSTVCSWLSLFGSILSAVVLMSCSVASLLVVLVFPLVASLALDSSFLGFDLFCCGGASPVGWLTILLSVSSGFSAAFTVAAMLGEERSSAWDTLARSVINPLFTMHFTMLFMFTWPDLKGG